MKRNHTLLVSLALVIIIVQSGVGQALIEGLATPKTGAATPALDGASRMWAGGGPWLFFEEDFTTASEQYLQKHVVADPFHGAPVIGTDGADRWRHEPLRWGQVAMEGPGGSWGLVQLDEYGVWRFGTGDDGGSYPTGASAELVTPTIDLRGVPRLAAEPTLVVDDGVPSMVGGTGATSSFTSAADEGYQAAAPGGRREASAEAQAATAALRILHAYDFPLMAGGAVDGGRVEVSFLDPAASWSPWAGLEATPNRLRIDGRSVQAGREVPEAASLAAALNGPERDNRLRIDLENNPAALGPQGTDAEGTGVWASTAEPDPSLYRQETVPASTGRGGPWQGFSGTSEGFVESVFDLSAYAGLQVRLRFVAATVNSAVGEPTTPGAGWILDRVQVSGAGGPAIDVLDLALPGDGALIPPTADRIPAIALHNRAPFPVEARLEADLTRPDGQTTHVNRSVTLDAGSSSRTVVPLGKDLASLGIGDPGVYQIDTRVEMVRAVLRDGMVAASIPLWGPSTGHHHFGVGTGSGWQPLGITAKVDGSATRSVLRETAMQIDVLVQGSQSIPTILKVGGADAQIVPVMLDSLDLAVGTMALTGPDARTLPASRDVAGAFGDIDDQVTVTWTWSGSSRSETLRLVLQDADGNTLLDAGRILVESAAPPALQQRFDDPWEYSGCQRHLEALGRTGVITCPAAPTSMVVSERIAVAPFDLVGSDGRPVSAPPVLRILHRGDWEVGALGGPTVAIRGNGDEWTLSEAKILGSPILGAGDVQFAFKPSGEGDHGLDRIEFRVLNNLLETTTFDAALNPLDLTVQGDPTAGPILIHGHFQRTDNTTSTGVPVPDGTPEELPTAQVASTSVSTESVHNWSVRIDRGDVIVDYGFISFANGVLPSGAHVELPTGRILQDAFVRFDGPVLLNGTQPELRFRHWLEGDEGTTAFIQVAEDPEGPWQTLARFSGRSELPAMRSGSIPMDGYAGREVHVRFVVHTDPTTDVSELGRGWFIEDVGVRYLAPNGVHDVDLWATEMQGAERRDELSSSTPSGVTILSDHANLRFSTQEHCSHATARRSAYAAGPTLVSEPIDLHGSEYPALTIVHSGLFGMIARDAKANDAAFVDMEYQVMQDDGTWPVRWNRATPHDPLSGQRLETDPLTGASALRILSGDLYPFLFTPDGTSAGIRPSSDILNTTWDLSPLADHMVRLRLHAWMESVEGGASVPRGSGAGHPLKYCTSTFSPWYLDWNVQEVTLAESVHQTDAEAVGIRLVPDDLQRLRALFPELNDLPYDAIIPGGDGIFVAHTTIRNEGILPIDATASLAAVPDDQGTLHISMVPDVFADRLESEDERDLRFLVQASDDTDPGDTFRMVARAAADGAQDTNNANDFQDLRVGVLPVRLVSILDAGSRIDPIVAGPGSARMVGLQVRNEGNLDESAMTYEARVVDLEQDPPRTIMSLGTQRPVEALASRTGTYSLEWVLDPASLPESLQPGHHYAVVAGFQTGPATPGMLDLSDRYETELEFKVEEVLIHSDLGPGGESVLPQVFPADAAWTPATTMDGAPAIDGTVPTWRMGPAAEEQAALGVSGVGTGDAWALPAYEGVQAIEHTLTSPVLPAHVVRSASQAILDLQYSWDDGRGDAVLEVRSLDADGEGDWEPAGSLRNERLAIVLSPRFPYVNASLYPEAYLEEQAGLQGPPFDECTEKGATTPLESNRCWWSPFPGRQNATASWTGMDPWDQEWVAALDAVLLQWGREHGADNLGVFSTMGAGTQLSRLAVDGALRVHDAELDVEYSFPIGELTVLENSLETYGALLVMGGDVVEPLAPQLPSLIRMGHDPSHISRSTANIEDYALLRTHIDRLKEILIDAPGRGVGTIAGAGPASTLIAYSGLAEGRSITTWQTGPETPLDPQSAGPSTDAPPGTAALMRCTQDESGEGKGWFAPCTKRVRKDQAFVDIYDPADPQNYYLWTPDDARSLALREVVQIHGAELAGKREIYNPFTPGGCKRGQDMEMAGRCWVPERLVRDGNGDFTIITAAYAYDVQGLVDGIEAELSVTEGRLPSTDGALDHLPPSLAYPVGGTLHRLADGRDAFTGDRMQVRIRVTSDPAAGGHGAFLLDAFSLLGTPNHRDASIDLLEPVDLRSYAPGSLFTPRVQVDNRGTTDLEAQSATMVIQQVEGGQIPGCSVATTQLQFTIPSIPAGGRATASPDVAFNNGRFPRCDRLPPGEWTRFHVDSHLFLADDDPSNDVVSADAFGQTLHAIVVEDVQVNPSQTRVEDLSEIGVTLSFTNAGTQSDNVFATATLDRLDVRPCKPESDRMSMRACDLESDVVAQTTLWTQSGSRLGLARDAEGLISFTVPADSLSLDPGVYRLTVEPFVHQRQYAPPAEHRWIHIVGPEATGRATIPETFTDLPSFSDGGFSTNGWSDSTHDGRYATDPSTRSLADGTPQEHGWRIRVTEPNILGVPGFMEWERSSNPTTPELPKSTWDGSVDARAVGEGDYGSDALVWTPTTGPTPGVSPSLASFQEPILSFLGQTSLTDHSALVVEVQLPVRVCAGGETSPLSCSWAWDWQSSIDSWIDLPEETLSTDTPAGITASATHSQEYGTGGSSRIVTYRDGPTNPLAGHQGLWGPVQAPGEAFDGWQRMEYHLDLDTGPLADYCAHIASMEAQGTPPEEPCRFAWSEAREGDPVPRPVRFRFQAASYGGDAGASRWRIDDLALTSHDLDFIGAAQHVVRMNDGEIRLIPLRIHNAGTVDDEVLFHADPIGPGLSGTSVGFALDTGDVPAQWFPLHLRAGESRVVWAFIEVQGSTPFAPGTDVPIPFVIRADSGFDPTTYAITILDARFTKQSFADLEVAALGIGKDLSDGPAVAAVGVPTSVSALVFNRGTAPMEAPVELVVVEERYDGSLDAFVSRQVATDASGQPLNRTFDAPRPLSVTSDQETVSLEWMPREEGVYRLSALVNLPAPGHPIEPVVEATTLNNVFSRIVTVGPVPLPDLRLDAAQVYEVGRADPVDALIEGHLYQVQAEVLNVGSAPALSPRVEFRVGGADPFSVSNQDVFPGAPARQSIRSAPWRAVSPPGADHVDLHVELFSDSTQANTLTGKNGTLHLPIRSFRLVPTEDRIQVHLHPGTGQRVSVPVQNQGTAPAIPLVSIQGSSPEAFTVSLLDPQPVGPGATGVMAIEIHAGLSVVVGAEPPILRIASVEDQQDLRPLPLDIVVVPDRSSEARLFPLETVPGPVTASMAISNPSNEAVTWTLTGADDPVGLVGEVSVTVGAFNATVAEFPVHIRETADTGAHRPGLAWNVVSSQVSQTVQTTLPLTIMPAPDLGATMDVLHATAVRGGTARFLAEIENTGNVPLVVVVHHAADIGTMDGPDANATLLPGESWSLPFGVESAGASRSSGTTSITWSPAVGDVAGHVQEGPTFLWDAEFLPAQVQIVHSDVLDLRPVANQLQSIRTTLHNPLPATVEAETLLVVDGILVDRAQSTVDSGSNATVRLGFLAGPEGTRHNITIISHPLGTTFDATSPDFWEAGDVLRHEATTSDSSWLQDKVDIPAPGVPFGVVLLVIAVLRRRTP